MNKLKIGQQTVFARFGLLRLCHVGFGRFMRQNQKINALSSCPLAQKIEHQTKIIICTIYEKKIMKFFLSPANRDASAEKKIHKIVAIFGCKSKMNQSSTFIAVLFSLRVFVLQMCYRVAYVSFHAVRLFSISLSLSLLFPLNIVYCSLSAIVLYVYM